MGHLRERAIAVVVIQKVVCTRRAEVGDRVPIADGHEEIDEAIIIVVTPRATGEDRVRGNHFLYGRNVGNAAERPDRGRRSIVVPQGVLLRIRQK